MFVNWGLVEEKWICVVGGWFVYVDCIVYMIVYVIDFNFFFFYY